MTDKPKYEPGDTLGTLRPDPTERPATETPKKVSKLLGPNGQPLGAPATILVPKKPALVVVKAGVIPPPGLVIPKKKKK